MIDNPSNRADARHQRFTSSSIIRPNPHLHHIMAPISKETYPFHPRWVTSDHSSFNGTAIAGIIVSIFFVLAIYTAILTSRRRRHAAVASRRLQSSRRPTVLQRLDYTDVVVGQHEFNVLGESRVKPVPQPPPPAYVKGRIGVGREAPPAYQA